MFCEGFNNVPLCVCFRFVCWLQYGYGQVSANCVGTSCNPAAADAVDAVTTDTYIYVQFSWRVLRCVRTCRGPPARAPKR